MGALFMRSPEARRIWDAAADISGVDLARLRTQGPADALMRTENAQVAVVACDLAAQAFLAERGIIPDMVAGHSVGELAALCVAGALSVEEALRLATVRGRLMGQVTADGAMGAVLGLADGELRKCCQLAQRTGILEIAFYNGPENVVVSGDRAAVESCLGWARAAGAAKVTMLATSNAFHSPLMTPAVAEWRRVVDSADIAAPRISFVANVGGAAVSRVEDIRDALVSQLVRPVQWAACMASLGTLGAVLAVECGDSRVLTGISRSARLGFTVRSITAGGDLARLVGTVKALRAPTPRDRLSLIDSATGDSRPLVRLMEEAEL
jgi:[acyl-carrier-protein] S-malonyltransferase